MYKTPSISATEILTAILRKKENNARQERKRNNYQHKLLSSENKLWAMQMCYFMIIFPYFFFFWFHFPTETKTINRLRPNWCTKWMEFGRNRKSICGEFEAKLKIVSEFTLNESKWHPVLFWSNRVASKFAADEMNWRIPCGHYPSMIAWLDISAAMLPIYKLFPGSQTNQCNHHCPCSRPSFWFCPCHIHRRPVRQLFVCVGGVGENRKLPIKKIAKRKTLPLENKASSTATAIMNQKKTSTHTRRLER